MIFDRHGEKRSHASCARMMRSAAKLTYQEAQAAIDGKPSDEVPAAAGERAEAAVGGLHGRGDGTRPPRSAGSRPARAARSFSTRGPGRTHRHSRATGCPPAHRGDDDPGERRGRRNAGRRRLAPVVYRVHDQPSQEKLKGLREFLETLDIKLPPQGQLKPGAFNRVLAKAKDMPVPELVNEVVLRSRAQAIYIRITSAISA